MRGASDSTASQTLKQTIAGAADNDIVRARDGKITTARQSFFGRILRLLPTSARAARESQAESATITHSLLTELKNDFDTRTAEAAMRMVGLGTAEQTQAEGSAPITVRQIREAHACAQMLSMQAQRSAATLKAISYSPVAPGFDNFARKQAGVDPERLTDAQCTHYQYMLQRHIAAAPGKYLEESEAVQKLAVRALKYVSGMSDKQIEAAQNDTHAQRKAAKAVIADLASGAGVSAFAATLDRLHDASQLGSVAAMLGDGEYGAFLSLDCLAMEHAALELTPQQARDAYFKAMASNGPGRATLAALDEAADDIGKLSRTRAGTTSELQLDLGAKRAIELHGTMRMVLKTLGERGGVANVEQQLDDAARKGPERTRAASGAIAVVGRRLNDAVAKQLRDVELTTAANRAAPTSEGEGILISARDEKLKKTLETENPEQDFYEDMDRMHVVLEDSRGSTRIGSLPPSDLEPTEEDKHAAKQDGLKRLTEFVGDEALAKRVMRLIGQKLFSPMSTALKNPDCPIHLADGTRGQIQGVPGSQRRSFTLSKTSDGEINVHVELRFAAKTMTSPPDSIRELDRERSHVKMEYDFSITGDAVRATSPVSYDFRLVEPQ